MFGEPLTSYRAGTSASPEGVIVMVDELTDAHPPSLDRRRLLVRAGAGAAAVWATPTIMTVGPAFASGSLAPEEPFGRCVSALLSGGPLATTKIAVEGDLRVDVNGATRYTDGIPGRYSHLSIPMGTRQPGDTIRVMVTDTRDAKRYLGPLYLHCPDTGAVQALDVVGYPEQDGSTGTNVLFYDKTFVVT